jgi:hypothetical protein
MHESLNFLRKSRERSKWKKIKIKLISPSNYVLYEEYVLGQLKVEKKGFKILLSKPLEVPAEVLLGPRIREAFVYDVEFCFTEITLSARLLGCTTLPMVVKEGDVVRLK